MRIVQINTFSNGSTGHIMFDLHNALLEKNIDSYVVWGRGRKSKNSHEICLNDKFGIYFHVLYSRITGKTGFASKRITKKLLKKLDEIKPDIIHLHNLHGYYINIEMLFNYIKEKKIRVIWTLHDCWAFTGQCPHFTYVKCNKWQISCDHCPMISEYPKTFHDSSKFNYERKKELFNGVDITLVTPSIWLSNLIKKSFLNKYKVFVINNGVNTKIFKYTKNNLREKYHLENKKVILGVASVWDNRKGLQDFIQLSKIIDDDMRIFLVGLKEKQIRELPKNIIGIKRTESQKELAEIYSMADVFFNASIEETFGLTTVESMACGTKVIVYNSSALPELVSKKNGEIASVKDINDVQIKIKKLINSDTCRSSVRKTISKYSLENEIKKYMKLYLICGR